MAPLLARGLNNRKGKLRVSRHVRIVQGCLPDFVLFVVIITIVHVRWLPMNSIGVVGKVKILK